MKQSTKEVAQELSANGSDIDGDRSVSAVVQMNVEAEQSKVNGSKSEIQNGAIRTTTGKVLNRVCDGVGQLAECAVEQVLHSREQQSNLVGGKRADRDATGRNADTVYDVAERNAAVQKTGHAAK